MKKEFKIYFLVMIGAFVCATTANAQKKASDITYAEALKKTNEKKAIRAYYINKMQQSIPPPASQAVAPVNQTINPGSQATVNSIPPAKTSQAPAATGLKTSQQPVSVPKKPEKE